MKMNPVPHFGNFFVVLLAGNVGSVNGKRQLFSFGALSKCPSRRAYVRRHRRFRPSSVEAPVRHEEAGEVRQCWLLDQIEYGDPCTKPINAIRTSPRHAEAEPRPPLHFRQPARIHCAIAVGAARQLHYTCIFSSKMDQ